MEFGEKPESADERDYKTLPPPVQLDDTVASLDAAPVPDPHADRNIDQHAALRDD